MGGLPIISSIFNSSSQEMIYLHSHKGIFPIPQHKTYQNLLSNVITVLRKDIHLIDATTSLKIKIRNGSADKELVEEFAKEQEERTKKLKEDEAKEELPKANQMNIIQPKKDDSATAIAKVENWWIWQPPAISSANQPLLNNYGLRNTKEKNSRAENTNKDVLRSHPKVKTPLNKRQNIPGAYIDDEQK
ncbi:hypothetical protein O181_072375 [Austropuccinia psidii MF-1]|uniref:Uncharacterized protein n=1 Tax=Austropuccinia psidii MF-1 TaxID=1389203 RepID=A0A9Q3IAZ6_9BASI|nr:hypothetical protein [Austropuccinia psidii MF-1]